MTANVPITILRRPAVEAAVGLSRSALYAKLTFNPKRPNDYDPTFPRPIKVGARAVGWIQAELDAWLESQIAKRRAATTDANQAGAAR